MEITKVRDLGDFPILDLSDQVYTDASTGIKNRKTGVAQIVEDIMNLMLGTDLRGMWRMSRWGWLTGRVLEIQVWDLLLFGRSSGVGVVSIQVYASSCGILDKLLSLSEC